MKSRWPNFMVIGAPKCGTRSLYNYLRQHPDVYMPETKEPHFFAFHGEVLTLPIDDTESPEYRACKEFFDTITKGAVVDVAEYTELFADAGYAKAVGEASTTSLYHPPAPVNIQRYVPDARLIAMLRNPVDRAFSAYMDAVRRGHEDRSFREALEQEPIDSDFIWWGQEPGRRYYVRVGFYAKQLRRYLDYFDSQQLKVYLFDDFRRDQLAIVRDIYGFLGVDDEFRPNISQRDNISGVSVKGKVDAFINLADGFYRKARLIRPVKNFVWEYLPKRWRNKVVLAKRTTRLKKHFEHDISGVSSQWESYYEGKFVKPTMDPEIRHWLQEVFRDDVLELQELLKQDLSSWLSDSRQSTGVAV